MRQARELRRGIYLLAFRSQLTLAELHNMTERQLVWLLQEINRDRS